MSRRTREDRQTVRKPPEAAPKTCANCGVAFAEPGLAWCPECRAEKTRAVLLNASRGQFPEEPW